MNGREWITGQQVVGEKRFAVKFRERRVELQDQDLVDPGLFQTAEFLSARLNEVGPPVGCDDG